jgi:SNF2 family DNA or RNA helicase
MKSEDFLQLPERIEHDITIALDSETQAKYDKFEESSILAMIETGEDITAVNAAVLTGKLLQYANGAIYDDEKNSHIVHDVKLEALGEIIEGAGGQQVLIFHNYVHDRERIVEKYKARVLKSSKDIEDWNKGKAGVMTCHPASAGHGLNLQAGGNIIVWYGLTWSLELYQQANARLHRQGQLKPVMIYRLLCTDTMDSEVARVLSLKAHGQEALLSAVKAKIDLYKKKALIS